MLTSPCQETDPESKLMYQGQAPPLSSTTGTIRSTLKQDGLQEQKGNVLYYDYLWADFLSDL